MEITAEMRDMVRAHAAKVVALEKMLSALREKNAELTRDLYVARRHVKRLEAQVCTLRVNAATGFTHVNVTTEDKK